MAQYVEIDNFFVLAEFHCPVCGATIFSEDGLPTTDPCEHLLFSWISEIGEFYNAADGLKETLENDDLGAAPWSKEFQSRCPDNAVLFALKTSEMACGPVTTTVVHGIAFPMQNETGDD